MSRTQRSALPPAKMLTAEVNSPGTTWAKTYGRRPASSTGRAEETAIQEEEPSEVYTRPSAVLRAPRAMQELSTPPATTRTARGRPSSAAASAVRRADHLGGGHDRREQLRAAARRPRSRPSS